MSAKPRRPLRVLLAWRPDSSGTENAEFVAWLARTQPLLVRTVTVISRTWSPQPGARPNPSYDSWVEAESRACSKSARRALKKAGVPPEMIDDEGCVVEVDHSETSVLIRAAEEFGADMMVLGSHPAAPSGRFRMGSTSDTLLHCAPLPLALAPRDTALSKRGVTRINCSYVDTDQSHEALRLASDLAARYNVPLRLVAFSPRGSTMYPTEVPFEEDNDMMVEWREQALALLDRGRARALSRHPELSITTETGSGYGWSGAMGALKWKKGDVLILGSSALGPFHRVFVGPSTNQIVRHSPVPVIISPV